MKRLVVSAALSGVFLLFGCPHDNHPGPAPTHAISGTVTRAWGGALPGVTVTLGGAASDSAVTDANGGYRFAGLADGSYTVTPALAGWVFTPSTPPVALAGADATQGFSSDGAYTISGTVSGAVQGGVSIALSGGGVVKPAAVSANGTGAYAFTGVPNGTYTLTPSLAGHMFVPLEAIVTVSGAGATQHFTSALALRLAGTVRDLTGAPMPGMTLRLSGATSAFATTDETGGYSFGGLAPGASYTVTAATFAYGAAPAEREYTMATDVTDADFVASISSGQEPLTYAGTVSYAGTKTGPVYVTVSGPYGGGNPSGGTGLATQPGPWSDRPFTVRNTQAGSWVTVRAWMDTLGTGRFNAGADPSAYFNGSPPGQPLQIPNLDLTDPALPTVASPLRVNGIIPGDGLAIVVFDVPRNGDGDPVADAFRVSWNDGATVDEIHKLGSLSVPAGPDFAVVHGLANGTPYWFRVDAYLEGAPLSGQTAVTTASFTPAPPSGSASVTGTVTHPAVASPSALYVVAQAGKTSAGSGGIYFQRIANPAGTETAYALSVPPGTYQVFGFIDVGDDGAVAVGEPAAFPGSGIAPLSTFVAGANAGPTAAIAAGDAAVTLRTSRWANVSSNWTYLVVDVAAGAKRPLSAAVTGPGLRGPVDLGMAADGGSGFDLGTSFQTDPVLPFAGDTYAVAVTYTDGMTATFQRDITGIFGTTPVATTPANGDTAVATVPTFAWSPPSGAPGPYGYTLQVWPENGDSVWETFLPGGDTSVPYDADGTAREDPLSPFSNYGWTIRATDENGNDASYDARFTTGAALLPLIDALGGTALDGLLWQTPQYTRSIVDGKAVLGVRADDMQAFTVQGAQYMNAIPVLPSAGRVTTFRATVSVPSGALDRAETGLPAAGMRLIYQPSANRGFPFPTATMNNLTASLEIFDDGSGLRVRRRFLHCDVASCATFSGTGITTTDPTGFTVGGINGVDASAPASYDTPYTFELSVDESTGVIGWSIQGGDFTAATTGTANVSTWISGVGMTLATGFTAGQLYARAIDMNGGSSAGIAAAFDDVYVGFNGGAAALWDDFGAFGTTFDPSKWGAADGDVWLSGGLHVSSALTTAVASSLGESTVVNLMYPTSLRAVQADVAFVVDESAAATGSSTSFSIVGALFNAGGGGANDATGDVRARVTISSGSGSSYAITRCGNVVCGSGTTVLKSGTLYPTRPMTVGTVHDVLVQWTPGTSRITIGIDEAAPVVVDVTGYVTVASPTPNYPLHQLWTNVAIAPAAPAGTSSRVEAVVTNLRGVRN